MDVDEAKGMIKGLQLTAEKAVRDGRTMEREAIAARAKASQLGHQALAEPEAVEVTPEPAQLPPPRGGLLRNGKGGKDTKKDSCFNIDDIISSELEKLGKWLAGLKKGVEELIEGMKQTERNIAPNIRHRVDNELKIFINRRCALPLVAGYKSGGHDDGAGTEASVACTILHTSPHPRRSRTQRCDRNT